MIDFLTRGQGWCGSAWPDFRTGVVNSGQPLTPGVAAIHLLSTKVLSNKLLSNKIPATKVSPIYAQSLIYTYTGRLRVCSFEKNKRAEP